jgi:hypothetical protein
MDTKKAAEVLSGLVMLVTTRLIFEIVRGCAPLAD